MQMNRTSALRAETSHRQDVLTTPALGLTGPCLTLASSVPREGSPGFVSLADICLQIRRSKSWVYAQGIVPITDDDGNAIDGGKQPPFPWIRLPPPCIGFGKKLWVKAEVDQWILDIRLRASLSSNCARSSTEVVA